MSKDYLALSDNDFEQFFKGLNSYVTQKCVGSSEWTHIPEAEIAELKTAYDDWSAAYEKTLTPHTPIDTKFKNQTKSAAKSKIRPFVNIYLRKDQKVVKDIDRSSMSIPNKDGTRNRYPIPVVKPGTDVVPFGRGQHKVAVINPESENNKRPDMVKGVVFAYRVRGINDPKASPEDMPSVSHVKPVHLFQWKESDYGKICDYASAYENGSNKRGPWSDVASMIIA
jgi:hypothetical protein